MDNHLRSKSLLFPLINDFLTPINKTRSIQQQNWRVDDAIEQVYIHCHNVSSSSSKPIIKNPYTKIQVFISVDLKALIIIHSQGPLWKCEVENLLVSPVSIWWLVNPLNPYMRLWLYKPRSCKRSKTLFKSLLFWLAGEVSWLAVEVLSPCQK